MLASVGRHFRRARGPEGGRARGPEERVDDVAADDMGASPSRFVSDIARASRSGAGRVDPARFSPTRLCGVFAFCRNAGRAGSGWPKSPQFSELSLQRNLFVVGSSVMSKEAQQGMRGDRSRAADTDRIQVAQLLSDAAAHGRLQMSEYEERLAKAYAARTYEELDQLRADLPGSTICPRRGGACQPAPSTLLLAIMGAFERRGRWNVPKRLTMFSFLGGGVVDLRYADFTSTEVEIHAYSIMGGQTILLPPEVNVDIHGHGVMGGFDRDVTGDGTPGAPTVKVRGFSVWGGVGVKRKNRKAQSEP